MENVVGNGLRNGLVIGVGGPVAIGDHVHPGLAVVDEAVFEGHPCRVFRADEAHETFVLQKVFEHIPGEFMSKLKTLDQPLLFQVGQWAGPGQFHRRDQCLEGSAEVLEALAPSDFGHGAIPFTAMS